MLIYQDVFSGDELFTDAQKIKKDGDDLMIVYCKDVKEETQANFDIGANASQEEQGEEYESIVKTGIDVVLNQNLMEVTDYYSKAKDYSKYLKSYVKRIAKVMKANNEQTKEKGESVMAAMKTIDEIVTNNFDDIQFFTAPWKNDETPPEEGQEPYHIPFLRDSKTNELTMYFFTRGLTEIKA